MNDETAGVGPVDAAVRPVSDALKQAYYYTELGGWRGPEVDDDERWLSVAGVASELVAAERERCAKLRMVAGQVLRDMRAQGMLVEWQTLLEEALGHNASLEGRAAFGASARSDCCASNCNYEERTDK